MSIQRNNFVVQINEDGTVYLAQGWSARRELPEECAGFEVDLYFSQMRHRVAALLPDGSMVVTTPTDASARGAVQTINCDARGLKCTGEPVCIGRLG